jgi:hypothetical protein
MPRWEICLAAPCGCPPPIFRPSRQIARWPRAAGTLFLFSSWGHSLRHPYHGLGVVLPMFAPISMVVPGLILPRQNSRSCRDGPSRRCAKPVSLVTINPPAGLRGSYSATVDGPEGIGPALPAHAAEMAASNMTPYHLQKLPTSFTRWAKRLRLPPIVMSFGFRLRTSL